MTYVKILSDSYKYPMGDSNTQYTTACIKPTPWQRDGNFEVIDEVCIEFLI